MALITKRRLKDRVIRHRSFSGFALSQEKYKYKPLKLDPKMLFALDRMKKG